MSVEKPPHATRKESSEITSTTWRDTTLASSMRSRARSDGKRASDSGSVRLRRDLGHDIELLPWRRSGHVGASKLEYAPRVRGNQNAIRLHQKSGRLQRGSARQREVIDSERASVFAEMHQRVADPGPNLLGCGVDGHGVDSGLVERGNSAQVSKIDSHSSGEGGRAGSIVAAMVCEM